MKSLADISEEIANNTTDGSSVLAQKFLERVCEGGFSPEEFQNAVRLILDSHPDMAILKHAFRILEKVPFDGVPSAASEFLKSMRRAPQKIAEYVIGILPDKATVMTYSRSGTVYEAIKMSARSGKISKVILSESRPDMEGRILAQQLCEQKIQVLLTIDGALGALMESVDAVLVGADAVTPEYVVNKVGTLQVALAANYADKPIFALASTHKFTARATPSKASPIKSIWENPPYGVEIFSCIFEKIPLALFRSVVCERGCVGVEEIEAIIE